jgi:hypothetical protein
MTYRPVSDCDLSAALTILAAISFATTMPPVLFVAIIYPFDWNRPISRKERLPGEPFGPIGISHIRLRAGSIANPDEGWRIGAMEFDGIRREPNPFILEISTHQRLEELVSLATPQRMRAPAVREMCLARWSSGQSTGSMSDAMAGRQIGLRGRRQNRARRFETVRRCCWGIAARSIWV